MSCCKGYHLAFGRKEKERKKVFIVNIYERKDDDGKWFTTFAFPCNFFHKLFLLENAGQRKTLTTSKFNA